ncbi:hypothetical protein [Streptomyces sp. NPDC097640]|uniref:hypothetical protein n=1 Tax=Streptomyces sp. NPDC097640 TaxID=3157229 RepID=UPI00332F6515
MSFDSEWSQLKADAAGQQSAQTRLNQLAAADGGGGGKDGGKTSDLIVHQDDLDAVGHEAFILHGELQKAADIAGAEGLGRERFRDIRDIRDGEVAETGE